LFEENFINLFFEVLLVQKIKNRFGFNEKLFGEIGIMVVLA